MPIPKIAPGAPIKNKEHLTNRRMHHNNKYIPNILFAILTAIFHLLFIIVYQPTWGLSPEILSEWNASRDFCLSILIAIIFIIILGSRTLFYMANRRKDIKDREYLIWQGCELLCIILASSLFLSLYFQHPFFSLLAPTAALLLSIGVYPYLIFWFLAKQEKTDNALAQAQETIEQLQQGIGTKTQNSNICFPDENGNIKLVVATEKIISIVSSGNYVNIQYLNDEQLTVFALRNTLKSIEGLCQNNRLIRCHRSYFINPHKIKLLRKEPTGMYAEIDATGVDDIPVSKSYAQDVVRTLATLQ